MKFGHPLELLVRSLELQTVLSREDRDAVLALPHTLRTLDPLSYLVREGEKPDKCPILVAGFAYRQKMTAEGKRQIVAIHTPGDTLDFQNLFLDIADHNVQMLTRGEVAFVKGKDMQELSFSSRKIAEAFFVKTLIEASILREWVVNVGRRKAPERIAHVLCELGARLKSMGLDGEYRYELPMTQEELGDAVGLTPVHVNRTLKLLSEEGLITREKRSIGFPDWERLCDYADFVDRYLHLDARVSS